MLFSSLLPPLPPDRILGPVLVFPFGKKTVVCLTPFSASVHLGIRPPFPPWTLLFLPFLFSFCRKPQPLCVEIVSACFAVSPCRPPLFFPFFSQPSFRLLTIFFFSPRSIISGSAPLPKASSFCRSFRCICGRRLTFFPGLASDSAFPAFFSYPRGGWGLDDITSCLFCFLSFVPLLMSIAHPMKRFPRIFSCLLNFQLPPASFRFLSTSRFV